MTRHALRVLFALALVGISLSFSAVGHVQATTYTPGCDLAALIAAVDDANTNGEADTINLEAGCTYTVTSTLVVEADSGNTLTINGAGAIINGGNDTRVLVIQSGAVVSINNLIIQNGYATNTPDEGVGGGNVVNNGNLTLTGVTLRGGDANGGGAGIVNNGTLTMTGSRVAGNAANSGGGIFNVGTATILNSEITGNGATYGGGITNNGTLTIVNSTIARNGADGGGAINLNSGSVTLINVTIVDNASFEVAALRNGGGGTMVIRNSIIDNAPYVDCNLPSVTFTYTIMNSSNCGFPAGTGNIQADPQLSGFTSGYYPLLEGSPAIDAGDNSLIPSGITTDQRGADRIQNGVVDMGAYEGYLLISPTATITAPDPIGAESSSDSITFQISLSAPQASLRTVNYTVGGTADSSDYTPALSGSVEFPAGTTAVDLVITPVADLVPDNGETVILSLAAGAGYTIGSPSSATGTIGDTDLAAVQIDPQTLVMNETSPPQTYQITLNFPPTAPFTLAVGFDATQVSVNGSSVSPVTLTFDTATTAATVNVDVVDNPNAVNDRSTLITHTIITGDTPEYQPALAIVPVTVFIGELPPPPPTPTCEEQNFAENGVVRTGIPNAIAYAINCRVLYQNGAATTWFGSPLYTEGNLGVPGLLELGVRQAIDIFSPPGMTYFEGGAVFCLRGEGTLIWLAASGSPRHAEIIGSYPVTEFPGFTCATLFEPGTLILVTQNPLER